MSDLFTRHPSNPIVVPGDEPWRRACVFNPGVILDDDGRVYLYERAAGQLRPFHCSVGLHESDNGVDFRLVSSEPVFTPAMAGSELGSVQDPRVVKIDGRYVMTYAFRPYAWSSHPTGVGVPESHETDFPNLPELPKIEVGKGSANVAGGRSDNLTRSGFAVSDDRLNWRHLAWVTADDLDDRDVILFPERIGGKLALLRRPLHWHGPDYGCPGPSIWLSWGDSLGAGPGGWSHPVLLAAAERAWEGNRIGGAGPPLLTSEGWLVFYHGVETVDSSVKRVIYRVGALLLDKDEPTKVLARTAEPIFEPEAYYEKFGLYIPNVVFPTGNFVKDGLVYMYYGVCDTAIALATAPLDSVLAHLRK